MRYGARLSGPVRSDRATAFTKPPQLCGVPPRFAMTPWATNTYGGIHNQFGGDIDLTAVPPYNAATDSVPVEFVGSITGTTMTVSSITSGGPLKTGAEGWYITRNTDARVGWSCSIVSQSSGTPGGVGTYTISGENTGGASITLYSAHAHASLEGGQAFGLVDDPVNAGRYAYITRIGKADQDASSQEGRKCMPRVSDSQYGVTDADCLLNHWSVLIPTETHQMFMGYPPESKSGMAGEMIYQNKQGRPIWNSLWLMSRGYSGKFNGPYLQLDHLYANYRHESYIARGGACLPADTWLHFVYFMRPGIMTWAQFQALSGGAYLGTGPNTPNSIWAFLVGSNGRGYAAEDSGNTIASVEPTHTTLSTAVAGGVTWRDFGPVPSHLIGRARTVIWMAIGDAAHTKVVDSILTTWSHPIGAIGGGQATDNYVDTQWGWYTDARPDAPSSVSTPNEAWTATTTGTDVVARTSMSLLWKDMAGEPVGIANQYRNTLPTDYVLANWFNQLRSR